MYLQPSLDLLNCELSESARLVERLHVQLSPIHFHYFPALLTIPPCPLASHSPGLITLLIHLFATYNNHFEFDSDHLGKELLRSST